MSKVGWSEDHVHPALTSRLTRSNHFRRDVGRAGVRAVLGDAYRRRFPEHFRWQLTTAKKTDCPIIVYRWQVIHIETDIYIYIFMKTVTCIELVFKCVVSIKRLQDYNKHKQRVVNYRQ